MSFKIAQLPGDGIGPEIVDQAVKVLNAVGEKYSQDFNFEFGLVGAWFALPIYIIIYSLTIYLRFASKDWFKHIKIGSD